MAYSIIKKDYSPYNAGERPKITYLCNTDTDISSLPVDEGVAGSEAIVIGTGSGGSTYLLANGFETAALAETSLTLARATSVGTVDADLTDGEYSGASFGTALVDGTNYTVSVTIGEETTVYNVTATTVDEVVTLIEPGVFAITNTASASTIVWEDTEVTNVKIVIKTGANKATITGLTLTENAIYNVYWNDVKYVCKAFKDTQNSNAITLDNDVFTIVNAAATSKDNAALSAKLKIDLYTPQAWTKFTV